MTKKDYILIGTAIKKGIDNANGWYADRPDCTPTIGIFLNGIAYALAIMFSKDNPNFDEKRWHEFMESL